MGAASSKSSTQNKFSHGIVPVNFRATSPKDHKKADLYPNSANEAEQNTETVFNIRQGRNKKGDGNIEDEFYDGIPRLPMDLSEKRGLMCSKNATVARVSRLGKAGTVGLEMAVEVLDTLGSSVTSLNTSRGFLSGPATKGNALHILAFEVANTIMKGSSLVRSLSKSNIRHLEEVVLVSEAIQNLVSKDLDELLKIVANDKREELKVFSGEVVRFGNRCKNSQWHNLDLYFEKRSKEVSPHKLSQEEAEQMIQPLMNMVQCTADLYHESNSLARLDQEYQRRILDEENPYATQRGNNILKAEIKKHRKKERDVRKKSLWHRSLEEVMEILVDIVVFLNREIDNVFGKAESSSLQNRLGAAGLALHYANIIINIDNILARSNSVPLLLRDTLYKSLPPSIKSLLRVKFQSFRAKEGLSGAEIKNEMEKILCWIVPIAVNTAKAHHGFGWVGEWVNTRTEGSRKSTSASDVIRIETFHYADKEKTEAYMLELLLWLNLMVNVSKASASTGERKPLVKDKDTVKRTISKNETSKTVDERDKLQTVSM